MIIYRAGRIVPLLLAVSGPVFGQDSARSVGDSAAVAAIEVRTSRIYELATTWTSVQVGENLLELPGGSGAALRGARLSSRGERGGGWRAGGFARVLAEARTPTGRYASEFYLDGEGLLLVFETFEYAEPPRPDCWRNFRGLAAWQRWTYFADGAIVFARSEGCNAPRPGEHPPAAMVARARMLVARLEAGR